MVTGGVVMVTGLFYLVVSGGRGLPRGVVGDNGNLVTGKKKIDTIYIYFYNGNLMVTGGVVMVTGGVVMVTGLLFGYQVTITKNHAHASAHARQSAGISVVPGRLAGLSLGGRQCRRRRPGQPIPRCRRPGSGGSVASVALAFTGSRLRGVSNYLTAGNRV